MVISQGDVFWVDLGVPSGSELGFRRPHVVIQNNLFNQSRVSTVVICALTSNLKRASAPGNVQLFTGEANLPKPGVVNVSQLFTVDKSEFIPVTFQPNVCPSKGPSSPMSAKEIEISADHLSAISSGLFTVVPTGTFTFHTVFPSQPKSNCWPSHSPLPWVSNTSSTLTEI